MKFLTCNPQPPQQYFHDDPPEIWVTWYNNALITCHLAKATAAAAGAAWYFSFSHPYNSLMNRACWAVTSVLSFREVYKSYKGAMETTAIRLDEREEEEIEANSEEPAPLLDT